MATAVRRQADQNVDDHGVAAGCAECGRAFFHAQRCSKNAPGLLATRVRVEDGMLTSLPPMSVGYTESAARTPLLLLALDRSTVRQVQNEKDAVAIHEKILLGTTLSPAMLEQLRALGASVDRAADTLHAALVLVEQAAAEQRVVREAVAVDNWSYTPSPSDDAVREYCSNLSLRVESIRRAADRIYLEVTNHRGVTYLVQFEDREERGIRLVDVETGDDA